MSNEHRLAFTLYNASAFESEAIRCLFEKQSISKKGHEYCRRLVSLGVTVLDIFSKTGQSIEQVESAIKAKNGGRCSTEEIMLRLTFIESETFYSPESKIWRKVLDLHRTTARKEYLRELFLYGYWFESLPSRNESEILNAFSVSEKNIEPLPNEEKKTISTTQSILGDLMP